VKIEGDYVFNGPRQDVWELVRDPDVLSTALPGTQSLTKLAENEYEGQMNVRVGPVAGVFAGRLVVSDEVPPESYTLTVEGKGAPGFGKGTGHVKLIDQGDGTTLIQYEGDMQVGGKIAGVGQRMLETASKSMIRQGLEALNMALEARVAAREAGVEVEYTPPSETKFAAAVAKDMAGQMLGQRDVQVGLAAAILLLAAIIILIWRRGKGRCC